MIQRSIIEGTMEKGDDEQICYWWKMKADYERYFCTYAIANEDKMTEWRD